MIDYQTFYQSSLTSNISDTDLVIPLDEVPIPSEGFLVIEPEVEAKREAIYFTSKDGVSVTVPSGAGNGRGYDGTTAVSHLQGANVIMAPIGMMFKKFGNIEVDEITINSTASSEGWSPLGDTPDTITANGNRSYDLVFNSNDLTDTLSPGMRLKATRTVTAPTQCADLEASSSHYFNKTSPAGMTFTDDFVVSAWVKLESVGSAMTIASRWNGTSGWTMDINSSGQIQLVGFNGGAGNNSYLLSYQSIPLNKWVHVAAQLDMSAFTATTTTSYAMIDGVDVPVSVVRGGTNPTALVQAGNLEIGGRNGGLQPFDGKIAQVAIYSAKVTQANVKATISQTLTGSETSLISAYSLSNSLNDLNTGNANNLTAQNSAVATATDTPFAGGSVGTTEYGIVTAAAFSTNTTLTVQVPEGYALPTTGGVSAVSYSINKIPFGFPIDPAKWTITTTSANDRTTASTSYTTLTDTIVVPIGVWNLSYKATAMVFVTATSTLRGWLTLSSDASTETHSKLTANVLSRDASAAAQSLAGSTVTPSTVVSLAASTTFTLIGKVSAGTIQVEGSTSTPTIFEAVCAYL